MCVLLSVRIKLNNLLGFACLMFVVDFVLLVESLDLAIVSVEFAFFYLSALIASLSYQVLHFQNLHSVLRLVQNQKMIFQIVL